MTTDNKQSVLTDHEIDATWISTPADPNGNDFVGFARAIERAVLYKLRAAGEPVAVLRYERGTPSRENEMPRVVSCNRLPDGEYHVYAAPQASAEQCPTCGTHEVSLERTCHNSSCVSYGEATTVYEGWECPPVAAPQASAEVRNAALEEAAKVIGNLAQEAAKQHEDSKSPYDEGFTDAYDYAELTIRSLKSAPAAEDSAKVAGDVELPPCTALVAGYYTADQLRAAVLADRQQRAGDVKPWVDLFWGVAKELNCLPSLFVDDNEHVLRAAREARAALSEQEGEEPEKCGYDEVELPPVPSAYNDTGSYIGYGKSDLRDYARAAVLADREKQSNRRPVLNGSDATLYGGGTIDLGETGYAVGVVFPPGTQVLAKRWDQIQRCIFYGGRPSVRADYTPSAALSAQEGKQ